jgi:glycine/D-amino acid oxidase-like deaminating enzyme
VPDVVVVGGGIIGVSCAYELARAGTSVTLIEREELAFGASGRNQGLWVLPDHPEAVPMARLSLRTYLELADDAPLPLRLDRQPVGVIQVAEDEDKIPSAREAVEHVRAHGIEVEELDQASLFELEPLVGPDIAAAWLRHEGYRTDPAALTVAFGLLAKARGAQIRRHLGARSVVLEGDRVRGVVTDEGRVGADVTVVAAGPWSGQVLDPIGVRLPVTGARGWLVRVGPIADPLNHLIEGGWRDPAHWSWSAESMTVGRVLEDGLSRPSVSSLLHPHAEDGTVLIGSTTQEWLTPEPDSAAAVVELLRSATRIVPSIAEAPVLSSWWGIRPLSADGLPLVGALGDGLVVATGHGSEGIILGAGTGRLVASIVLGTEPPFDPAPFDPLRFAATS